MSPDLARLVPSLVSSFTHHNHLVLTHHIGTIVAGLQAGIGNVAVGSLSAAAQSVAMGGTISGVVTAIGTAMGGTGAAAVAVLKFYRFSSCTEQYPVVIV